jgi:diguanylate cyclase (GGDEF)-like protein
MKKTRRNALLSAVLCLSASCLMPFGTPPEKADAAATVTIGYYTEVPEFQSGSSDEEKKSGYAYEYYQILSSYTGWNYEYKYGSFSEMLAALKKGEVDILAGISGSFDPGSGADKIRLTPYRLGTENSSVADLPGCDNDNYFIAVSADKPELFSALLEAQKQINEKEPALCETLTSKYMGRRRSTGYSAPEKKWLGSHSTILIGYLDNYMPYSDKTEKRNEADGIMADLFNSLAKVSGKSISAVKYTTYTDLYDALENGKIDAMFPAYRDLWRLERENTVSTGAVLTDRMELITAKGVTEHKKTAVMATSPVEALYINDNYPDTEIIHFSNFDECIRAVRKGAADSFIVEENVLNYWLSDGNDLSDLDITELETAIDFCFAAKKENYVVCRILETALASVDQSEIDSAVKNNLHRENTFTFSEFFSHNISKVIILALILMAVASLILFKNRRVLRRKQNEIENAHNEIRKSKQETTKYRQKVEHDHLTGVFSRAYFLEMAENKIKGHRPNDTLQIVMMDIDNFKSVNDTYGHDNGDVVLRRLGEILKEISRVNGFAGRFGGEEFFIFLYGEDPQIQKHIIEKVCRKLKETDFDFTERHITVSVGVTVINDGDTPEKCIERADKALYYSKNHGKDQVNWYEDVIDKL